MIFVEALRRISLYGVFLPGMVMILLQVQKWSRIPIKKMWVLSSISIVLFCIAGGTFEAVTGIIIPNVVLLTICFLLYIFTFTLSKKKLLYVFLTGTALSSFGGLLNYIVVAEAGLSENEFPLSGLLCQYALSFLFLLFAIKIRRRIIWFLEQEGNPTLWNTIWLLPLIITALNIGMIPSDYSNVRIGHFFEGYLVVEAVIFVMYIFTQILLYIYTYDIVNNVQLSANLAILESQINTQKDHVEQYFLDQELLREQRHDLRHQYAVLSGYLEKNETDKMRAYLNELIDAIPQSSFPTFCANQSVNSLCSYYATHAQNAGIDISIIIDIPEKSEKISDSHLCIVIGNLLDNALHANEGKKGERFIKLRSSLEAGMLYITMDNTYVPGKKKVHADGSEHGIGLLSVRNIAEAHGGSAEFFEGRDTFQSSVWMEN